MVNRLEQTLRVSTFGKPLAVLAAMEQGFFASRELAVEYRQTTSSTEQIRELIASRVDVVHTAIDNVIAYVDEGEDLTAFLVLELGISQKLVVGPEVGRYEDLTGRLLGVDALSTGYAFVLREMLARNGLNTGSYELVGVGGSAERARALADGSIAGTLLAAPHDWPAKDAECRVLDHAAAYLPEYPSLTSATTRSIATDRRDALVSYAAAVAAGRQWAVDPSNRKRAIALIARQRNVSWQLAQEQYAEEVRHLPIVAIRDALRSIDVVRDLRSRMTGGAGGRAPIENYFDASFMENAGFRKSDSTP